MATESLLVFNLCDWITWAVHWTIWSSFPNLIVTFLYFLLSHLLIGNKNACLLLFQLLSEVQRAHYSFPYGHHERFWEKCQLRRWENFDSQVQRIVMNNPLIIKLRFHSFICWCPQLSRGWMALIMFGFAMCKPSKSFLFNGISYPPRKFPYCCLLCSYYGG